MNAFKAIFKRELISYFTTPVAYIFLVVFIFSAATWAFVIPNGLYKSNDANLLPFFNNLPKLFIFFAPAITMRMWAEERRTGTIELLFTLPISLTQAILAKFFAAWVFFIIAIILTFPIPWAVINLGNPDMGPIYTGYIGAVLMAGCTLAIGTFFSALTKNQVVSFILATVVCLALYFVGDPIGLSFFKSIGLADGLVSFIESLSFQSHYYKMQLGMIQFRNVFYFVVVSAGFLYATKILIRMNRA